MTPPAAVSADPMSFATCPACHTADSSITNLALSDGAGWHCSRCSQGWDARRLATAAAYADWEAGHTPLLERSR